MGGFGGLGLMQPGLQSGRQFIQVGATQGCHRDFFMHRIDRDRLERRLLGQRVGHITRQTGLGPRRTCFDLLRLFHQPTTNTMI